MNIMENDIMYEESNTLAILEELTHGESVKIYYNDRNDSDRED